jgi:hypothetical protein
MPHATGLHDYAGRLRAVRILTVGAGICCVLRNSQDQRVDCSSASHGSHVVLLVVNSAAESSRLRVA